MNVLGLDLSINATGAAYPNGDTITFPSRATGDRRLFDIRQAVLLALGGFDVEFTVIEDLPTHAKAAGITGMVHGVVRLSLLDQDIPYVLVPPATVKKYAVGKGNATKADMRMALYTRTGVDQRDDNQVDAAWLRFLGLDLLGCPELVMPKVNRAALTKLQVPEGVA